MGGNSIKHKQARNDIHKCTIILRKGEVYPNKMQHKLDKQ